MARANNPLDPLLLRRVASKFEDMETEKVGPSKVFTEMARRSSVKLSEEGVTTPHAAQEEDVSERRERVRSVPGEDFGQWEERRQRPDVGFQRPPRREPSGPEVLFLQKTGEAQQKIEIPQHSPPPTEPRHEGLPQHSPPPTEPRHEGLPQSFQQKTEETQRRMEGIQQAPPGPPPQPPALPAEPSDDGGKGFEGSIPGGDKLSGLLGGLTGLKGGGLEGLTGALAGQGGQSAEGQTEGDIAKVGETGDFLKGIGLDFSDKINEAQTAMRAASGDPTAIKELAQKKMQDIKEGAMQMGQSGAAAVKAERAGDIGAGFAGMGEGFGKMIGGPLGDSIKMFSKLAKTGFEALEGLRDWSSELHNANMRFAEFSSAMSRVEAQEEIRRMHMSRERGQRRADSAGYLAEGRADLDKALAPIEDIWANLKGFTVGWLDKQLAKIIDPLGRIAREINELLPGGDPGDRGVQGAIDLFARRLNEDEDFDKFGRPRRHR